MSTRPAGPASGAAVKLCGFLLLLAAIFVGAHAAGAHVGPVTTTYVHSGGGAGGMNTGGGGSMNMGGTPAPPRAGQGGRR